jgi:hypothetical protein
MTEMYKSRLLAAIDGLQCFCCNLQCKLPQPSVVARSNSAGGVNFEGGLLGGKRIPEATYYLQEPTAKQFSEVADSPCTAEVIPPTSPAYIADPQDHSYVQDLPRSAVTVVKATKSGAQVYQYDADGKLVAAPDCYSSRANPSDFVVTVAAPSIQQLPQAKKSTAASAATGAAGAGEHAGTAGSISGSTRYGTPRGSTRMSSDY